MDVTIPTDYTQYLRGVIQELKGLLNVTEPPNQRLLKNVKLRKLKLVSKHRYKSKANLIKSKQDKLSLLKHRKATIKYKLSKKYNYINPTFWILNTSDNIYRIERDINILRQKHGFEKYNKYIKMYYITISNVLMILRII